MDHPSASGENRVFDFNHCRTAGLLIDRNPRGNAGFKVLAIKCLRQQRMTYTVMYMDNVMVRTQVYLSREQEQALKSLAITSGTRQSELIREAVDLFLSKRNALQSQWKKALQDMKGIWADDESMGERMDEIRQEFNR